jgi:hypothetical protein
MPEDPPITYHEGLTRVLEMKRAMLRTVLLYCAWGFVIAVGLFLSMLFLQSFLWTDVWSVLRKLWR